MKRSKTQTAKPIQPVILCGGTGTRLWPLSREAYPKQFIALHGASSLFAQTLARVSEGGRFAPPLAIVNEDHRFIAAEQMRAAGVTGMLLVEPIGRNTAPAAAAAALHALEQGGDPVLLIMPADHAIEDRQAFADAIETGIGAARGGRIVLFGIHPTSASTGYGYIRRGASAADGTCKVERFVEKPDGATAERYLVAGDHLWNSGIFLVAARQLISELERHAPEVVRACRAALAQGARDLDFLRLDRREFAQNPPISLDHAVMERTDKAVVVPIRCGWNDLGAWSVLWDIGARDGDGNVMVGEAVCENSRGCYLRGEGPMVAAVGVDDLIVVATDDVVLVTRKNQDQDVKGLVERLKKEQRQVAVCSRRVYRPWGFYESVQQGHRYQVKRITVRPGAKLSLQKHFHRAEHWVVVNGTALVTRDADSLLVRENESIYLPLGTVHRLENPGKLELNLIEVQSGAYLGEDDIVRIEDVYDRV